MDLRIDKAGKTGVASRAYQFEFPTWSTSVVSVNDKLYLAGGGQYRRSSSYSASGAYRCGRMMWNHGQVFEGNVGVKPHQVEEGEGHVTVDMVNPWSRYPRMKDARRSFPMVHLDDYLYAIGGEDDGYKAMKEAERFSFKDKKWEKIADLPVPCYYACATVYKGKILVYGSQPIRDPDTPAQHNLQMYDPATNQWENLLTEQHVISKYKKDNTPVESDKKESDKKEGKKNKDGEQRMEEDDNTGDDDDDKEDDDEDDDDENDDEDDYDSDKDLYENENEIGILLPKNALVVDGDDCFRVVYTPDVPSRGAAKGKLQPVVHKLVLDFTGSKPSVEIGEPQDQNLMPNSKEGAFQIHNQVYINMRGCVRNTGIQIAAGQTKKVDLGVWKKLFGKEEWFEDFEVQFANLKFNKRAVFCDRCVKGLACTNDGGRESELESVSGGGGGDCVVS
ncbi:uncharacterized protein [Amphiura filiformis]|uniref:uncharacterized protein isoform X1 n=1 Tax=Amphiura filiformis TaxID=82378 RepID=UPI003B213EEC